MSIGIEPYAGEHAQRLIIGGIVLWFSYRTIVGFKEPGEPIVTTENVWGNTTGKHLNAIDGGDKKDRLPSDVFRGKLNNMLARHGLPEA